MPDQQQNEPAEASDGPPADVSVIENVLKSSKERQLVSFAVAGPIRIVHSSDAEALAQLIENLQRREVHPLEEARDPVPGWISTN